MRRRWEEAAAPPDGLVFRADFLRRDEEAALLERIARLSFHEVRMKGVAARRTTAHFGWSYGYESWQIAPADPPPDFLLALRERAAAEAHVAAEELAEVLVTKYPAGAGIGWHRDARAFGEPIVGISLGSACAMRFRRAAGIAAPSLFDSSAAPAGTVFTLPVPPRSLYILAGPARREWQHSIPPTPALRYSVTYRTLRAGPA